MHLKIVGGLYLVWLGIKTWRDQSALTSSGEPIEMPQRHRIFLTALGVAITNPKAIAVQLAIIPPFLNDPGSVYLDGSLLALTYASVCLISHLCVTFLSGQLRGFFITQTRLRYLRRVIGTTFMGFGAALATAAR